MHIILNSTWKRHKLLFWVRFIFKHVEKRGSKSNPSKTWHVVNTSFRNRISIVRLNILTVNTLYLAKMFSHLYHCRLMAEWYERCLPSHRLLFLAGLFYISQRFSWPITARVTAPDHTNWSNLEFCKTNVSHPNQIKWYSLFTKQIFADKLLVKNEDFCEFIKTISTKFQRAFFRG